LLASSIAAGCSAAKPDGAKLYLTNCASCHQVDGKGVAGSFPPLAGSEIVKGDPARAIHIVKYGLTGSLQVAGKNYDGMMPAWSPQLSNDDIAAALSYVRTSWGNGAGAVTAAQVAGVAQ
jgi:mono/diheme cytochrome c family protein